MGIICQLSWVGTKVSTFHELSTTDVQLAQGHTDLMVEWGLNLEGLIPESMLLTIWLYRIHLI